MNVPTSYRESNRARLRATLVEAARELTIERGWAAVRMADVATAAGVSRQTVYNEFGGRPGLAEALAAAEVTKFVAAMRADFFGSGADARAAVQTAAAHALIEAQRNPLVRAVLTSGRGGADDLLPYLTTRSGMVLDAAGAVIREWAATFHPNCSADAVQLAAESLVRLTVSHLVLPLAPPAATASALAEVFARLLCASDAP
jgi:AcrR family transcriptional regulator